MQRIVIFANGDLPDPNKARSLLRTDDFIVCADGGTHHALALGLKPNLVIGDLDSLGKNVWQELEEMGIPVELFPRDKNETDLELAINRALELGATAIVVIGALGGRLDQTLGNLTLLTDIRLSALDIRLDDGVEEIFFCRNQVQVHGRSGDIISLIPWQGAVSNVETGDLKWPLENGTLHPERTRGISNEMLSDMASVRIGSGLLLVVHQRISEKD